jgi:hypothetical protein
VGMWTIKKQRYFEVVEAGSTDRLQWTMTSEAD